MSVLAHWPATTCAVFVCFAGDEPCSSSRPVCQSGLCLYSQRTLWLPGDTRTPTQGKGTLSHDQRRLCINIAFFKFLFFFFWFCTFRPLRWFHWLEGAGGCQQQPQEESIPRGQCWVSAEVRGNEAIMWLHLMDYVVWVTNNWRNMKQNILLFVVQADPWSSCGESF